MVDDFLNPEIRDFQKTYIVGLEQSFHRDTLGEIATLWKTLHSHMHEIPNAVFKADGGAAYGISTMIDRAKLALDYMAAIEVQNLSAVPNGMDGREIGGSQAAVFTLPLRGGPIGAEIGAAYDAIWRHWMPTSDYVPTVEYDIERYDHRFDPATLSGELQLIVPIKQRDT